MRNDLPLRELTDMTPDIERKTVAVELLVFSHLTSPAQAAAWAQERALLRCYGQRVRRA
jgi:hypothetical protein